jgi:hypothetical protein
MAPAVAMAATGRLVTRSAAADGPISSAGLRIVPTISEASATVTPDDHEHERRAAEP